MKYFASNLIYTEEEVIEKFSTWATIRIPVKAGWLLFDSTETYVEWELTRR